MANRSNGYFTRAKFYDFCIVIRFENDGGCLQTVIRESSRRIALGKAFGGDKGEILFCKTPDEMTRDERWSWGVPSAEDRRAALISDRQRSMESFSQLDMY